MNTADTAQQAQQIAVGAADLASKAAALASSMGDLPMAAAATPFFMSGLTVFVLACFVGYYVVWRVTPALHSPLMAVTNAISSVIIVGALIAAGPAESGAARWMGFFAVLLAAVNIFGGFIVTQRMLQMFSAKKKPDRKS